MDRAAGRGDLGGVALRPRVGGGGGGGRRGGAGRRVLAWTELSALRIVENVVLNAVAKRRSDKITGRTEDCRKRYRTL